MTLTTNDDDNMADVPTVAEYRRALPICIRRSRTARETEGRSIIKDMLVAHYAAPDRTVTAPELARLVGLENLGDVNLRYGKFGTLLFEELKREPTKFRVAILVRFGGHDPEDPSVRWTLMPELATAMEEMGWVRR